VKDYHINIFWSDEDGCYVADIPDLFACSAFGDSPEQALAELEQAKENCWQLRGRRVSRFPSLATDPRSTSKVGNF
jgi:predicted RNase H-like HicB family nuclease